MAYAQLVDVESVQQIRLSENVIVNHPTISPDGSFAVVSDLASTALRRVDLATGKVDLITDNGSGEKGHFILQNAVPGTLCRRRALCRIL